MSQTRLFSISKVGCFLDAVGHTLEKRRGEDVKVLVLTLRVAPLTAAHATAMPDGVKAALFKLNSGDPKETIGRVDFRLAIERQRLEVAAAPDAPGTFAFDQVLIKGIYARAQKDRNGFDLVFKAVFGPVDAKELEQVQAWLLSQKFVTFERAEPGFFEETPAAEATDADRRAREKQPSLRAGGPEPEWKEGEERNPNAPEDGPKWDDVEAATTEPARVLPHRNGRGKRRAAAKTSEQASA